MWELDKIALLIWLGILAWEDGRTKEISTKYLWGMGVWILCYLAYAWTLGETMILHVLGGLVGGIFLIISKITKENLGYGDSFVLFLLGIYLGIWEFLEIGILAYALCFVYVIINLSMKKFQRDTRIAFLPFLFIGYLGGVIL